MNNTTNEDPSSEKSNSIRKLLSDVNKTFWVAVGGLLLILFFVIKINIDLSLVSSKLCQLELENENE